uniref:Myeloid cell surface antigen CD33-like n=1 Tax=Castor canadensis TaxID=51338 RepID=A0A8B7V091_CASCN|nr:myeloid cell surface antigen CD33-like [Castor canadensis]
MTFPAAGVTVDRTVQLNLSWNRGTRAPSGVVQGANWGGGVTVLLALGLCLIFFIVKTQKKKEARTAGARNTIYPDIGPISQGPQQELKSHSPTEPSRSPGTEPTLGMDQDLHYACLSFHGKTPQEDTSSQYSEIQTH